VNFSQELYSFVEGSGNTQIELLFSNPSSFDIVVHVMWNDITATGLNSSECVESDPTRDYLNGVPSVKFPANTIMQFVNITICDDNVLEEDETFSVTIVSNSNPDNVTNGSPDNVIVTFVDDDRKYFLLLFQCLCKHWFILLLLLASSQVKGIQWCTWNYNSSDKLTFL